MTAPAALQEQSHAPLGAANIGVNADNKERTHIICSGPTKGLL